jgi:hypothetical protein
MNPIIEVLIAFRDNTPMGDDHLTNAIVTKLYRRGYLSKSVATGEITLNDYGAEKLEKALKYME